MPIPFTPKKSTNFKDAIEWFVFPDTGKLTARQEVFSWRYALHGNGIRAMRESHNRTTKNSQNQGTMALLRRKKIINRIKALLALHHSGIINLSTGPWQHYGERLEGIGKEFTQPARPIKFNEILDRVNEAVEND